MSLKGELIRSRIQGSVDEDKGGRKCDRGRCQICRFVNKARSFGGLAERKYYANCEFDCDSKCIVYIRGKPTQ